MDPNAQAHLAELISYAREGPRAEADADEWRSRTFVGFNSALGAFQAVGLVSPEEVREWTNRMLVALGEEPLQPLPPGTSGALLISIGGKRPPRPLRPPDPPPASVFLGLVPVNEPDRPLDYGGRVQILGVELYSDKVSVNWRLAPEPDYEVVFADELAEQEADLEEVPEAQRTHVRNRLIHRLQMQRRFLALSDDVGTQYHGRGGGSSGGGGEKRGHTGFTPRVPLEAKRLTVAWGDNMRFEVQLPSA
jgi:hypothetical protein